MDTRNLTCFLAVADEGNLTRAARAMHLSQSALSGRIRQLEEDLGISLFVRRARGMDLSPEGEVLLPAARRAVRSLEEVRAQAASLAGGNSSRLVVGLNTDPVFLRMSALSRSMKLRAPGVQLSFVVSQTLDTRRMLLERELDVGFRFGAWTEAGVHDEFITTVPLAVVFPSEMGEKVEPGSWASLAHLPWISNCGACPFWVVLMERMSSLGLEPEAVAETDDEIILRELVSEGVGAAVMRLDEAEKLHRVGRVEIWPERLQVPLSLSYAVGRGYGTPLREFREVVREVWAV